ncbi:hypothetical protein RJ639_041400 [Escallonia herrerae]|uniref:Retrotransposon gag domain-containing protein n=1 Tax=Escallonia herrerae TaxID=1293975 RepID=A0AA89B4P5_9ASTE|nr:hypothetical protein RJ639_041400 [Escallonia herrerae]
MPVTIRWEDEFWHIAEHGKGFEQCDKGCRSKDEEQARGIWRVLAADYHKSGEYRDAAKVKENARAEIVQWSERGEAVGNLFWHLERYFEPLSINDAEEKMQTTVMYLMDTAAQWWGCRYMDGCDVKTWEKFKRELQRQFYPDSVDDKPCTTEAEGSISEYVKDYLALMLEIPEMSERQRLCFFIDGLQYWVATELQRMEPHDLASAMTIVKRSKSGSSKATDDDRSGDKGCCHHHKGEKKHEGSRKQGDSHDHKAHGGLRSECFYCAGPHCGRYCPHNGKMIAFLEKYKGSKGDSSSSDGETRMGTLQMVNAFVHKSKEEVAKWTCIATVDKLKVGVAFDGILDRKLALWSAMLADYMQNGFYENALRLFMEMVDASGLFRVSCQPVCIV